MDPADNRYVKGAYLYEEILEAAKAVQPEVTLGGILAPPSRPGHAPVTLGFGAGAMRYGAAGGIWQADGRELKALW